MAVGKCIGWWQQTGLGRQPMENLLVSISNGRIQGTGTDIVAPFTLSGRVRADGTVEILKQYERRHSVVYVGRFDGEGTLYGTWDIFGLRGDWSIRFLALAGEESQEIEEILPAPSS